MDDPGGDARGCASHAQGDGRGGRGAAALLLDDAQIASSRAIMGIDTQLVDDGTYGFEPVEELTDDRGGAPVPLVRMTRHVDPCPGS